MNHSCCPNVIVTYKGTLAEVRAVQEIHPGEEVSVAAGGCDGGYRPRVLQGSGSDLWPGVHTFSSHIVLTTSMSTKLS